MYINEKLYKRLNTIVNPTIIDAWLGSLHILNSGSIGTISKAKIKLKGIPHLKEYYIVKTQPKTKQTMIETLVLRILSNKIINGTIPELFTFLYKDLIIDETVYFIMEPNNITLGQVLDKYTKPSIEWWSSLLYQISLAVFYLEELEINHNDLTFDNIMLKQYTTKPEKIEIVIIDFGSAVIRKSVKMGLPNFVLGRDLNYFLYILSNTYGFPSDLKTKLDHFIFINDESILTNDHVSNIKHVNISTSNWKTSGKNLKNWLAKYCPVPENVIVMNEIN